VSMKEDMTRDIEVHNTIVGDEGTERTLHLPLDVEDRQEVNHDVVDMRHEVDRLDGVVVVDSRGIVLDKKGGRDRVIDRKGFRRRRLGVYRGPLMQDRCLPCFQTMCERQAAIPDSGQPCVQPNECFERHLGLTSCALNFQEAYLHSQSRAQKKIAGSL
jgi:hypothetical protein